MPSRATVKEVEDDRFVHEEQVALDLGIERVGKLDAAYVSWAWFGPLSADTACLHDLGYELRGCFQLQRQLVRGSAASSGETRATIGHGVFVVKA